jgi:hypothetical protein
MKIVTLLPSATELVCGVPERHPLPAGMPQARTLAGNGMSAPAAVESGA